MNFAPSIQAAVYPIARNDLSEESLLHQEEGEDTPASNANGGVPPLVSTRIWKGSIFFSIIFIAALTMTLILLFVVNLPITTTLVLVALNATLLSALALSITLCLGCINCNKDSGTRRDKVYELKVRLAPPTSLLLMPPNNSDLSKKLLDFMEQHEQKIASSSAESDSSNLQNP